MPVLLWRTLFALAVILFLLNPGQAGAHAELERAVPEPNTRLASGPEDVELFFNEAIEANVGSVTVLDSKSKAVTNDAPVAGSDRKTLTLALPKLGEGLYTVSYSIISADGHPVSGSYIFVVGNPPEAVDASDFDVHTQLGHEGHHAGGMLSGKQFILYTIRIAYYGALLLSTGIMLWSLLTRRGGEAMAEIRRKYELNVMRTLLVAVILYIFVHAAEMMQGYPAGEYVRLFGQTSIGRAWIVLIGLAAAGFPVLRLGKAVRASWAAVLLGVESWSGHAIVFSPKAATVLLDFIHLASSSLWVGGLALLIALWLTDRKEAGRFAEVFSLAALLSIGALIITGVAMTLLFLPSLRYLLYTTWGMLLLVKSGLVLLVLAVGAILRLRVRRGELPNYTMLRIDLGLMGLIVAIVSFFTYIAPLPANEPVAYHKMGEDMHMTLRISPNKPGADNTFTVKIWLPEQTGAPKSVKLRLKSQDRPELGAIDVPVEPFRDDEISSFEGFVKAAYKAEGPYLPFAGRWVAEIRVMDHDDNEKVERYEFRNY